MRNKRFLQIFIIMVGIIAISRISNAQDVTFEVSLPGINIVVGDPYPVVYSQPVYIYNEPLQEGSYYYDERNDCYYDNNGYVYYSPTNVVKHDNGNHKGWYKHKSKRGNKHNQERE
jgi:hypothetical protein